VTEVASLLRVCETLLNRLVWPWIGRTVEEISTLETGTAVVWVCIDTPVDVGSTCTLPLVVDVCPSTEGLEGAESRLVTGKIPPPDSEVWF